MGRHLQDMRLHSEIASCTAAYLAAKLHNFSGTASTTAIFQKLLHATSLHGLKKSAFRCTLQLFKACAAPFAQLHEAAHCLYWSLHRVPGLHTICLQSA